jgi:two-component system, chemotaxis family, protein-glutamate methylesterase/glutaminase
MIRVLIVDDLKVVQDLLYHMLSADPEIQVIGVANSGEEAVEMVKMNEPDVVTMDVHLPGMDGFDATRKIMEVHPMPVIIVSGSPNIKTEANIFRSLEAGALAVVSRPPGIHDPEFGASRDELIMTIKNMSKVKITRLYPLTRIAQTDKLPAALPFENYLKDVTVVAIGGSTGGNLALQKILSSLQGNLPVPVLIAQTITPGFTRMFMEWLSITSGIKLKLAADEEPLLPGTAYIAPDHFYMGISRTSRIKLTPKPVGIDINGSNSINILFDSVANFVGKNAIGVLLSGEGIAGASGLKSMKDKGAVTMVQNELTSVVFEMPGEALRIGASDLQLSPILIAQILAKAGLKK